MHVYKYTIFFLFTRPLIQLTVSNVITQINKQRVLVATTKLIDPAGPTVAGTPCGALRLNQPAPAFILNANTAKKYFKLTLPASGLFLFLLLSFT